MANTDGPEMMVYAVHVNLTTGELVARDLRGVELTRTSTENGGGTAEEHAEVARLASETLASWYN